MSQIRIEDVTKIILDTKEKYNINDVKFEIFALAAVLDELKIDDFKDLSILRTSSHQNNAEYPFQLGFPKNSNIYTHYDKEKKSFITETDNYAHRNSSHAVHTNKEMEVIKDIYNIFEKNQTFNEFKKEFTNHLSKKIDEEYIEQLTKLYDKNADLQNLIFFQYLKEAETVDILKDRTQKIDVGLNLFRTGLSSLNSIRQSDHSPEHAILIAAIEGDIDEKIKSRHFETISKFDNLSRNFKDNYLTDDDTLKIKNLLKTDYVKNNTVSGIVTNDTLSISEKFFGIVGVFYEELRNDFINSLEDVTLLKTREKMSANFHIDEIKEKILESFPKAFHEKKLKPVKTIEFGEFTSDLKQAGIQYRDYLNNLKSFGLIRGFDLIKGTNSDLNIDAFFEESYSTGKRVTFKALNEVETLYDYTFKEHDVYGVKLLTPKNIYISKELSHKGFNESLHEVIQYAKDNKCIMVTSEIIDDSSLFDEFDKHLSRYGYKDVAFYNTNDPRERNYLNTSLTLQKEFGAEMKFDVHVKIKDLTTSHAYIDTDDLIAKGKKLIKHQNSKKSKIKGPN